MKYIRLKKSDAQRYWNLLNALDYETEFMMYEPGERSPSLARLEGLLSGAEMHPEDTFVLAAEESGELIGFVSAVIGAPRIRRTSSAACARLIAERASARSFFAAWTNGRGRTRSIALS